MISFFGPFYSRLLATIAYGPWGRSIHQFLIFVFKKFYNIEWPNTSSFLTLGDFFLRDTLITTSPSLLTSPAEAQVLQGPEPIDLTENLKVKGVQYDWRAFKELDLKKFETRGQFWNFYLSPPNYHWVHSPASGKNLEGIRFSGKLWPVNRLGRYLSPSLYSVNERLIFKFLTEDFGEVIMICVGALGVSGLLSVKREVSYGSWTKISDEVEKGERLLGFKLGSSVLLLIEKPPPLSKPLPMLLRVGDALC